MKRLAEMTISLGAEVRLVRFSAHEALSELFTIDCEVVLDERVDLLPSLGKTGVIAVYESDVLIRRFHAMLIESHYLHQSDQGFHHTLVMRPWLLLLGANRTYRIYEQQTVVQILKDVLSDYSRHVDFGKLTQSYQPWPYCTQYRESDLNFIQRLMEREGIYFYFRHEADDHVLVLADGPSAHKPSPGYETVLLRPDWVGGSGGLADALWDWQEHVGSGIEKSVLLQSFDYEKTRAADGKATGAADNPAQTQDFYQYTGDFVDEGLARHWAKVRFEASRARRRVYTGSGDMIGLACGGRFTLDSTDAFDRGREFIITALDYSVDAEPFRSDDPGQPRRVTIETVTSDTIWRAPPTTQASIAGPETAIVMQGGADDADGDAMGRIRVRFLWRQPTEADIKARSCWLRVSHPSAGAGFGHVTLPRQDEEVIVDFLDGNPDRPIVTGRVYNSQHPHAYALPANRTRSFYRSHTIGSTGSYAGAEQPPPSGDSYNELRFEDKGGSEEVYMRAQRNRLVDVLLDDCERVQRDSDTRIGRDRTTAIRHDDSTTVETGDYALDVLAGSATIRAAQRITLQVGASSITITPAGITLTIGSTLVNLTEAGIVANALTLTAVAETEMTLNSALTNVLGDLVLNLTAPTINLTGDVNFL